VKSLLVIKIGAIGDVVLTLPILQKVQDYDITWVVGKSAKPLLEAAAVHRIIEVDEKALLEGSFFSKLREVGKVWKALFFRRFDLAITAHVDARYRWLTLFCFKRRHRFFTKKDKFPLGGLFHSYSYLRLALGDSGAAGKLSWPMLNLPPKTLALKKPVVAFSPGGDFLDEGKRLRIWPLANYLKCIELLQEYDCECIVIGASGDSVLKEYFAHKVALDLIGETTLLELLAILKQCFCLVTHDGGPLHLARLVGCKVCALFGPTSPYDFTCPGDEELVFWKGSSLSCSPCYKGKYFAKCFHQRCMKAITAEEVVQAIVQRWRLRSR